MTEPEASAGAVCLMCAKLIELSVIWIQRLRLLLEAD